MTLIESKHRRLTIGKLARSASVNVETVRYYQRIGLLEEPMKPMYGYRDYPVDYIARVHFIKRAQQLGFTLKEIAELLTLGEGHCDDVRALAEQKCNRVNAQIKDLQALRNVLEDLINCCHQNRSREHCSFIDALTDEPNRPA